MKTLRDYIDPYFKNTDYFLPAWVRDAFIEMISKDVKEVGIRKDELACFLQVYDQVLPWNWDGASFRGVKLIRV